MMSRGQLVWIQLSVALTTLTGVAFAVMKYFMKSDDPFAVVNHPLQPYMLSSHDVVAPAAVFGLGWLFGNHIWPGFTNRQAPKRKSGSASMWMIVPMVVSGYLIQIATNDPVRNAMAVSHWIASGLFVIGYVTHLLTKKPNGARAANGTANGALRSTAADAPERGVHVRIRPAEPVAERASDQVARGRG